MPPEKHPDSQAIKLIALNLVEMRKILQRVCSPGGGHSENKAVLERIAQMEERFMSTAQEIAQKLRDAEAKANKIRTEIQGVQTSLNTANEEIVKLKAIIEAGGVSDEIITAVNALEVALHAADEQIPDFTQPV